MGDHFGIKPIKIAVWQHRTRGIVNFREGFGST
jgi:hypothetical protein